MDIKYNRKVALVVYIIAVLISIFVLGGNFLKRQYNTGTVYFNLSGMGDVETVNEVILNAAGQASNMTVIIDKTDYSSKEYDEFKNTIAAVKNEKDIYKKFKDYEKMCIMAVEYYDTMDIFDFSDKDKEYMMETVANLTASKRFITYSQYYRYAEMTNETFESFPASLIRGVRGISLLPTFDN